MNWRSVEQKRAFLFFALVLFLTLPFCRIAWGQKKVKFSISKETTYIVEPLKPDGSPDYLKFANRKASKGVTLENNADVLLWRAMGIGDFYEMESEFWDEYFRQLGIPTPIESENRFITYEKYAVPHSHRTRNSRATIDSQMMSALARPWLGAEHPNIEKWLSDNEFPMRLIATASQRSKSYSPLVNISSEPSRQPGILNVRLPAGERWQFAARAFASRGMLRVAQGDLVQAWEDAKTCHRIARHVSHGTFLVQRNIGIEIEELALRVDVAIIQHLTPEKIPTQDFRKYVESLPGLGDLSDVFNENERYMILDICIEWAKHGSPDWSTWVRFIYSTTVDWDVVLKNINSWFDRCAQICDERNWKEQRLALKALDSELGQLAKEEDEVRKLIQKDFSVTKIRKKMTRMLSELMISHLLPEFEDPIVRFTKLKQRREFLNLALALESFKIENKRYPERLAELTPLFLDVVPRDRFSGSELIYSLTENEYSLYSVGENQQNDGGPRTLNIFFHADDFGFRTSNIEKETKTVDDSQWVGKTFMSKKGAKFKVGTWKLELNYDFIPFKVTKKQDEFLWMGLAWISQDQVVPLNEAADYFTAYLEKNPTSSWAYGKRGFCWFHTKKYDRAIEDLTQFIEFDTSNAFAFHARACVWKEMGKFDKAIEDFTKASRLAPEIDTGHNSLAWLLSTCPVDRFRDGKRAVDLATKACELSNWKNATFLETLAASWAETGDFEKAEKYQKLAIEMLAPIDDKTDSQNRLTFYESGKPYRDSGEN